MLDDLNRALKAHGLWFPVDISTASRATIGGMTGNNSCGARSLRYGNTRENVISVDALLADGRTQTFRSCVALIWPNSRRRRRCSASPAICWRSARAKPTKSWRAFPKVQRRVGGYNLDTSPARTQ